MSWRREKLIVERRKVARQPFPQTISGRPSSKSLARQHVRYPKSHLAEIQKLRYLPKFSGLLFRLLMRKSTNLGQNGWKIKTTPPPISVMEKMARFRCSASTSLNWAEGCFYFSFYSVQDCSLVSSFLYVTHHTAYDHFYTKTSTKD